MASRASAIEPDLAAVQIAAGLSASSFREGLRHFARAAAVDPSSAEAFHQIGDQLIHVDTARAIRLYEHSRALDPRMFANYADLVLAKVMLGNRQEAAGEVDALLRAIPDNPRAATMRAWLAPRGDARSGIEPLQQAAAGGQLPAAGFVSLAQRLASAGRSGEALAAVDSVLARTPDLCEARALRDGLSMDLKRVLRGAGAGTPVVARPPRCAALTAASAGDAAAAAASLHQIANDEFALRSWMQIRFGATGETVLNLGLYPWGKVAQVPDVVAARKEIRGAFDGLKKVADQELKGLP
jgi:tetratricopeptide (TPR) repeat protein